MLTPVDIKNKKFAKGFRGYEAEEVDKFMAEVLKEYEYLYMDNAELKETIERVSSKLEYYQQMEASMQSTLAIAQETADEVKTNSEKKAALLEQETEVKCMQALDKAKEDAKKVLAEAEVLYGQTKTKTDNMLRATEAESDKIREDARQYLSTTKERADIEIARLKATADELYKKRLNNAETEAKRILAEARTEANKLLLEANTNYRKLIGDAEERSRNLAFEAETKVTMARNDYENQVKKAMLFKKNMEHLLQTQMDLLQEMENHTEA